MEKEREKSCTNSEIGYHMIVGLEREKLNGGGLMKYG